MRPVNSQRSSLTKAKGKASDDTPNGRRRAREKRQSPASARADNSRVTQGAKQKSKADEIPSGKSGKRGSENKAHGMLQLVGPQVASSMGMTSGIAPSNVTDGLQDSLAAAGEWIFGTVGEMRRGLQAELESPVEQGHLGNSGLQSEVRSEQRNDLNDEWELVNGGLYLKNRHRKSLDELANATKKIHALVNNRKSYSERRAIAEELALSGVDAEAAMKAASSPVGDGSILDVKAFPDETVRDATRRARQNAILKVLVQNRLSYTEAARQMGTKAATLRSILSLQMTKQRLEDRAQQMPFTWKRSDDSIISQPSLEAGVGPEDAGAQNAVLQLFLRAWAANPRSDAAQIAQRLQMSEDEVGSLFYDLHSVLQAAGIPWKDALSIARPNTWDTMPSVEEAKALGVRWGLYHQNKMNGVITLDDQPPRLPLG